LKTLSSAKNRLSIGLNIRKQQKLYRNLFQKHHLSHESLHWCSRYGQIKRFEVLASELPLSQHSVLDLGCGLGDFYEYLTLEGAKSLDYTGYDICRELIDAARIRYPEGRFHCFDILGKHLPEQFDFVLASGIFGFSNREHMKAVLHKAFEMTRKALVFNFFFTEKGSLFSLPPSEVLRICRDLNPRFLKVRKEYLKNDQTYFIQK
jgi:SAM-dependent methyltransferase